MSVVVKKLIEIEKNHILNRKRSNSHVKNTFYCPSNVTTDFGRQIVNDANHLLGRLTIDKILSERQYMSSIHDDLDFTRGQ